YLIGFLSILQPPPIEAVVNDNHSGHGRIVCVSRFVLLLLFDNSKHEKRHDKNKCCGKKNCNVLTVRENNFIAGLTRAGERLRRFSGILTGGIRRRIAGAGWWWCTWF